MSIILPTWETETRRKEVQSQPLANSSQKKNHKKGLAGGSNGKGPEFKS
jgi:hypothetical protein